MFNEEKIKDIVRYTRICMQVCIICVNYTSRINTHSHKWHLINKKSLWNPEVQCYIHKDCPIRFQLVVIKIQFQLWKIIFYENSLSQIKPNPLIHIYFFKIHSNIVFPSKPRPSSMSVSCRFGC